MYKFAFFVDFTLTLSSVVLPEGAGSGESTETEAGVVLVGCTRKSENTESRSPDSW